MLHTYPITVKSSSGKDRGVFATRNIKKREIIEVAPVLILQFTDFVETRWNLLFEYYFWLDECVVLALGYGSMYNHSSDPNAAYKIDTKKRIITFRARKEIKKGQEILFNYKGDKKTKTPLWFEREK